MGFGPKRIATFALFSFIVASLAYLAVNSPSKLGPSAPGDAEAERRGVVSDPPAHTPHSPSRSAQAELETRPAGIVREEPREEPRENMRQTAAPAGLEDGVIVYYFHTTRRCYSCRLLEALTKEAIEREFSDALRQHRLEYRPINIDLEKNQHFVDDYRLYTKSVVLVQFMGGEPARHKNLQKVWTLLRDKPAFLQYVREEVRAYLRSVG